MKWKPHLGSALLTLLSLAALAASASAAQRTDVVNENYLTGYLIHNAGQWGLTWDAGAASDDEVDSPGSAPIVVESPPLPRTMYLNVSRVIQVDVFLKDESSALGDKCAPGMEATLRADNAYLAGSATFTNLVVWSDTQPEPKPPGYVGAYQRLQAELDEIPKGARLHVELPIGAGPGCGGIGLQGDHRSVVLLPLFSPEEILFRIPKYQQDGDAAARTGQVLPGPSLVEDLLDKLPLGLGALIPGAAVARGRTARLKPLLLVALLLGTGLAGCTRPAAGPEETAPTEPGLGGSATSYIVKDDGNETGLANASRGSIYGVVADPDRLPVNGAYVLLLGSTASARTDALGRFRFTDLAPGTYTLRFDRTGFLSLESKARVEAGAITKIEVALQFVDAQARDQRPHRHDYWEGKDAKVVFDGPVRDMFALAPPATIIPGTVDIEINVTWDPAQNTAAAPSYLQAHRADDPRNETYLRPRGNGIPYHLRTTWEMTDPGHTAYTYWGLFGVAFGAIDCTSPFNQANCLLNPAAWHVRVTLHRGVVPLEAAHRDLWHDASSLTVVPSRAQVLRTDCLFADAPSQVSPWGACPLSVVGYGNSPATLSPYWIDERHAYNATWPPVGFVPYETAWFEATLKADREITGSTSAAPWSLYYRSAWTSNLGDCLPRAPQNKQQSLAAPLAASDAATRTWTFRVPLAAGHADPPYALRTNWCFYVTPTNQADYYAEDYAFARGNNPAWTAIKLTLNVTAHRDGIPS